MWLHLSEEEWCEWGERCSQVEVREEGSTNSSPVSWCRHCSRKKQTRPPSFTEGDEGLGADHGDVTIDFEEKMDDEEEEEDDGYRSQEHSVSTAHSTPDPCWEEMNRWEEGEIEMYDEEEGEEEEEEDEEGRMDDEDLLDVQRSQSQHTFFCYSCSSPVDPGNVHWEGEETWHTECAPITRRDESDAEWEQWDDQDVTSSQSQHSFFCHSCSLAIAPTDLHWEWRRQRTWHRQCVPRKHVVFCESCDCPFSLTGEATRTCSACVERKEEVKEEDRPPFPTVSPKVDTRPKKAPAPPFQPASPAKKTLVVRILEQQPQSDDEEEPPPAVLGLVRSGYLEEYKEERLEERKIEFSRLKPRCLRDPLLEFRARIAREEQEKEKEKTVTLSTTPSLPSLPSTTPLIAPRVSKERAAKLRAANALRQGQPVPDSLSSPVPADPLPLPEPDANNNHDEGSEMVLPEHRLRYAVERAKSGRSLCRTCKDTIEIDSLRFAIRKCGEAYDFESFHHFSCFWRSVHLPINQRSIRGFDQIEWEYQEQIRTRLAYHPQHISPPVTQDERWRENRRQLESQSLCLSPARSLLRRVWRDKRGAATLAKLLAANGMMRSRGRDKLVERVVDACSFGVPARCERCRCEHPMVYSSNRRAYICPGRFSPYSQCLNEHRNPPRTPFVIPASLQKHFEGLRVNILAHRVYSLEEERQEVFSAIAAVRRQAPPLHPPSNPPGRDMEQLLEAQTAVIRAEEVLLSSSAAASSLELLHSFSNHFHSLLPHPRACDRAPLLNTKRNIQTARSTVEAAIQESRKKKSAAFD